MSEYKTLDHSNKLLIKIRELLQTDACLCDLVLIIDGREFPVHKIVVAAVSEYFRSLIQYDVTPPKDSVRTRSFVNQDNGTNNHSRSTVELKLENVTSDTFRLVIDYIYSGEIQLNEDNVEDVLVASDMFAIDELKTLCCTYLGKHITPANCLGIRALAQSLGCSDIADLATQCVENDFSEVCRSDEFLEQTGNSLYDVLCLDSLNLLERVDLHNLQSTSEITVLEAVLCWVNHDKPHRQKELKRLLAAVRWSQIKKTGEQYKAILKNNSEWKTVIQESFGNSAQTKKPKLTARGVVEVIVLCGGGPRSDTVYFIPINPAAEQVKSLKDLSRSRHGHSVVVTGGLMYVIGGGGPNGYITRCERYNPSSNTWSPLERMLRGRSESHIAAINNKIYILAGSGMYGFGEENEVYDITTDTWSTFPHVEMLIMRGRRHSASLNDKLYFLSETTNGNDTVHPLFPADEEHSLDYPFRLVQYYDPITNKWSAKSPEFVVKNTASSDEAPTTGKPEDCIFVISALHQFVYDTKTNVWDNLPLPRTAGIELDKEGLPTYSGQSNILRASDRFCIVHASGILQTSDPRLGEWDLMVPSACLPSLSARTWTNNMNQAVVMNLPTEVFIKAFSKGSKV